jgi:hypothetical protein
MKSKPLLGVGDKKKKEEILNHMEVQRERVFLFNHVVSVSPWMCCGQRYGSS